MERPLFLGAWLLRHARFVVVLATSLLMTRLGAAAPGDPEASPAAAASPTPTATPPSLWQKPLALEGHLGFGTPLGLYGVALDVTPMPWVSLNLGVGQSSDGTQFAAMARGRMALRPLTGGIGAGISGGPHTWNNQAFLGRNVENAPDVHREWKVAFWGNAEIYLEARNSAGLQWRGYIGYAALLNSNPSTCSFSQRDPNPDVERICTQRLGYLYVGTALGFAFSL